MYHNVKFALTDTDESDDCISEHEFKRQIKKYSPEQYSVPPTERDRLYSAPDFAFIA